LLSFGAEYFALQFAKLTVVLYGCETWSLTLKEKHRLKVFENRVLRRVFGPKSDEGTDDWVRLHNEELHALYFSPNIIQVRKSRMIWARRVARMEEMRGAYRFSMGKFNGKKPLGLPSRKLEDNIKMVLQEVGWGIDWIDLIQDRVRLRVLVNAVINLRFP
jgi:hypothetical protein